jgi:rhodanese-related sulfurtransferase
MTDRVCSAAEVESPTQNCIQKSTVRGESRTRRNIMAKTAADLVAEARAQVKSLTPQEAFDEATSGRAVLLDVREPVEWEQHIEGALQIPRGLLEFQADPTSPRYNAGLDPTRPVIVYCRSGVRAVLAALTLQTLGYTHVANLEGGFSAWQEAGLPSAEHHTGF